MWQRKKVLPLINVWRQTVNTTYQWNFRLFWQNIFIIIYLCLMTVCCFCYICALNIAARAINSAYKNHTDTNRCQKAQQPKKWRRLMRHVVARRRRRRRRKVCGCALTLSHNKSVKSEHRRAAYMVWLNVWATTAVERNEFADSATVYK